MFNFRSNLSQLPSLHFLPISFTYVTVIKGAHLSFLVALERRGFFCLFFYSCPFHWASPAGSYHHKQFWRNAKKNKKTKRRNTGIILFCLHLCAVEAELGTIACHNSGAVNNSWGRVQGPNEKREEKRKRPLAMFSDHSHCRQKGQQIQIIRRPTGQTSGSVQNWCHVKGHEPWLEAARWKRVS